MTKETFEQIAEGLNEALLVAPYLVEIEQLKEELKWAKIEAEQARVMADALQTKLDVLRKDYDELYEKWCDRDRWY